jgi:nucleotide-binding universal stress UspA family protein
MSASTPQVLIPIDFSPQSLLALEQSPRIAKFYKAELTLLFVIDDGNTLKKVLKKKVDPSLIELIQQRLNQASEPIAKKHNLKVNTLISKGRIYEEILEEAEKIDAKLIIMGKSGSTKGLKKKLIGSNAIRVVKESKCPVITIKGKHPREGCKNILLPIDLSKESREKVKNAIMLGKLYGATVHVVSTTFELNKESTALLTKQVQLVKKFIEESGVKCTTELVKTDKKKSSIAETVVKYANKIDADLIILMTQQEGQKKPAFLGSTAQDIINDSDVPVMSIVPSLKKNVGFSPY